MSEKRRALGRGLGALIPSSPGTARPVDVFFRESPPPADEEFVDRRPEAANGHQNGHENGHIVHTDHTDHSDHTEQQVDAATSIPTDGLDRDTAREDETPVAAVTHEGLAPVPGATFAILPIAAIRPNPRQPRTVFDEDELAELAASIREIGVLQPVVVRPVPPGETDQPDGPRYELIMGERRLRASQLAGQDSIPAIVKETADDDLLRDALLENLHRSQLNPLEEAAAYQQLLDDFGCSHEELATRIGRSRPQISNTLRLLRLPPLVARRLAAGVLSAGHARALLGLDDGAAMERLAQRIVAEGLSVRSVEEIVAMGGDDPAAAPKPRRPRAGNRHPQLDDVAARLSDRYDTRVTIALGQRKGRLTVEFASVEDLNRIVGLMDRI